MYTYCLKSISNFHSVIKQRKYNAKFTIYRGVLHEEYDLRPRIGRPETKIKLKKNDTLEGVEKRMLRWFEDRALPYLAHYQYDDWEWLALAQHYGLPTRFLDWTRNPLAAAYFAVEREHLDYELEERGFSGNSAIYVLNWGEDYLISKYAIESDIEGLLPELYDAGPIAFPDLMKYAPPHFDMRIVAQSSLFTIHPNPRERYPFPDDDIEKLIIPRELRKELKQTLNVYGVNRLSLFPGLDSLGKHLEWLLTDQY